MAISLSCTLELLPTYSDVEKSRKGDVSWNALTTDTPMASAHSCSKKFIMPDLPCSGNEIKSSQSYFGGRDLASTKLLTFMLHASPLADSAWHIIPDPQSHSHQPQLLFHAPPTKYSAYK